MHSKAAMSPAASPPWPKPCAAAWPSRWARCATAAWPRPACSNSGTRLQPGASPPCRTAAVIFNRKDALQDAFLAQHFKLQGALYPRHFVPSVDAFERALELGMGWGMVPDLLLAQRQGRPVLQEVLPGRTVDVMLYWQHWQHEPAAAQRLTEAVKQAARAQLLQN